MDYLLNFNKEMDYLLILNEEGNPKEIKEFISVIEGATDRVKALTAIQRINLFKNVEYVTRSAKQFGAIITENYSRREGNTLYFEFLNDNTLNCSYTILKLN